MPMLNDIAQSYAERLKNADCKNRVAVFREIINEINELTYEINGQKIDNSSKLEIYRIIAFEISEYLKAESAFASGAGTKILIENANDELMSLVNEIINKLNG